MFWHACDIMIEARSRSSNVVSCVCTDVDPIGYNDAANWVGKICIKQCHRKVFFKSEKCLPATSPSAQYRLNIVIKTKALATTKTKNKNKKPVLSVSKLREAWPAVGGSRFGRSVSLPGLKPIRGGLRFSSQYGYSHDWKCVGWGRWGRGGAGEGRGRLGGGVGGGGGGNSTVLKCRL